MKIVFAATPGQEKKVTELVGCFYSTIFPQYFSDEEIRLFEQQRVLRISNGRDETFDTLSDAYKVMTCLQTIISIIESYESHSDYRLIFAKNASMLADAGIHFPFSYEQFEKGLNIDLFSIYSKATNQFLI